MADPAPRPANASGDVVPTGIQPWAHLHESRWLAALGEIFAVVIDTSVITGDVIKTLKGGLPSPLFLAMRTGLIRGFMAHHTWAEVPRVLAKRAPKEGVDLREAESMWWNSYVKVIRFVPTADLPPGDPALERILRARDASDMPTLRLASLIAPTVVLASDRDLQDVGLAYERWWEVPDMVRKVVAAQGGTELAARAVFGVGYGTVAVVRGVARALQRPPIAIAAITLVAVALLTRRVWYPYLKPRIDRLSPPVRRGIGSVGQAAVRIVQEYGAALTIWSSAQRGRAQISGSS